MSIAMLCGTARLRVLRMAAAGRDVKPTTLRVTAEHQSLNRKECGENESGWPPMPNDGEGVVDACCEGNQRNGMKEDETQSGHGFHCDPAERARPTRAI